MSDREIVGDVTHKEAENEEKGEKTKTNMKQNIQNTHKTDYKTLKFRSV